MRNAGKVVIVLWVLLLASGSLAFAENGFLDLASPVLLGGGGGTATLETPFGTLLNPSVSADRQRVTLDLSYIALTQLTPAFALGGDVVNLGVSLPNRAGVFTAIGRFATSDFNPTVPGLQWGPLGGVSLSFSKDLFPDLYVGVGLGGEFGNDWGLGLDLGFLNLVGDVGFLKDFRWGAALRNLGRAYPDPAAPSSLGLPPAFTPAIGADFTVVKAKDLQLSFAPDLSFPSVQDIRFALGMTFSVANILFLNTAYTYDARQVYGVEPSRSFPFAFGLTLKLGGISAKAAGQDVTEVNTNMGAAPLEGGMWGLGLGVNVPFGVRNVTPPAITLDTNGTKYIAPNFSGMKDALVLPLAITDKRYVKGYRFIVTDSVRARWCGPSSTRKIGPRTGTSRTFSPASPT